MSSLPDRTFLDGMTGKTVAPESVPTWSLDAVKSASRVMDIFEFFYRFRGPARAVDIASFLSIPKSSTNGLLKTLVDSGYLTFNARNKSYFLSFRLVPFGNWLSSFYFGPNRLITMMEDLRERAGECVALTVQNGLSMQFVAMLQSPGLPDPFAEGRKTSILGSATGGAMMMTMTDSEIMDIIARVNRGKPRKARDAEVTEVIHMVRQFQAQGHSVNYRPSPVAGTMTIAMPLPQQAGNATLVLSVGGLKTRIEKREKEIAELMRDCIERHLSDAMAVAFDEDTLELAPPQSRP